MAVLSVVFPLEANVNISRVIATHYHATLPVNLDLHSLICEVNCTALANLPEGRWIGEQVTDLETADLPAAQFLDYCAELLFPQSILKVFPK